MCVSNVVGWEGTLLIAAASIGKIWCMVKMGVDSEEFDRIFNVLSIPSFIGGFLLVLSGLIGLISYGLLPDLILIALGALIVLLDFKFIRRV